ncbi:DUF1707 domain-containing protein [Blastococcus sp. CT_GayMR20]|uniref:DUF1707 SHOCT-like domain-containing protein n=1 Tax=Blastococcus sp. CT_GayMR20 TaxID=2559609 RepID=UPI00107396CB|nr:DUF1707 domain-containing protein [Blastococcus sp. CT_GayMR20]TFV92581.1 DUF1707 domain-containing protein [Blastococcus sp. CT_GayMR20]TFV92632.1 DUF1707 domain-containing protein [Blastococcus sp. CT_GayMR20]
MPEPHLRAADTDRAAVATVLGQHMSAGRLTVDEYDDRLARAYAAKTYGELAELTADLPAAPKPRAPEAARPQGAVPACTPMANPWAWHGSAQSSWRSWLTTALIVVTIWAATSLASWEFHYFWPIWVIGPWGAVLLAQTLTRGRHDRERYRQLG